MNWKSTSAAVSTATVLATWLGWSPAPPPAARAAAPERVSPQASPSDIQAQAARLQVRVRKELEYRDPTRNPFRFGVRPPAARPAHVAEANPIPAGPVFQPLPFVLSGMAAEAADGTTRRTAILTSGSDVLFAKEGDRIGAFTLTRVDETGVEVTAADGSVRRLTLTP